MRLYSLHPKHLDPHGGINAAWREALMAQAVLLKIRTGEPSGYQSHPQLRRFLATPDPLAAIGRYLEILAFEANEVRKYRYDTGKILVRGAEVAPIPVTTGQLAYEARHLNAKLAQRSPNWPRLRTPEVNPLFTLVEGPVEEWEVAYWRKATRRGVHRHRKPRR
jgi:hypothetical protein